MGKIILSTVQIDAFELGDTEAVVIYVTDRSIQLYEGNINVVAVIGSRALSRKVAKMNFPGLKMYQLTSAGFDHVPIDAFKAKAIAVCNAGAVFSQSIAETVVYGMLQFAKRYWENPKLHFLRPMRKYNYISEIANKKAIILGCGNIGTAIAKCLLGFNMHIDGYDPYCLPKIEYGYIYKTYSEMIAVLSNYQYIITTLPDTEETRGSLNTEFFNAISKDTIVVNVGRMAIFNQKDFLTALRERKFAGAVLDMFERIPNPITNPFRRLSNVIVLPGVAAISYEANVRMQKHIEANCRRVIRNDEPQCRIGCHDETPE